MTITLANRMNLINPSPTLALNAKAAELKAQGKHILNLTVGEPDFETPKHIQKAAVEAMKAGKTKYTATEGTVSLRKAICQKFERDNKLQYDIKQIIVSSGGKQSLFNLFLAIINPGDEVIIPCPCWVSYPDIVKFAEGKPVFIETNIQKHYKITATQLEAAITPKTKAIIINSPSNPTGMVYNHKELRALADVLLKHPEILIVSDDIYEPIIWSKEPFANLLMIEPKLYDRFLIVNGASKAYAMTGWRIGYTAGPVEIIKAMTKLQSQSTSNACSIAQAATEMALLGDQKCVEKMRKAFKRRHQLVYKLLKKIEGMKILRGEGAFYAFPDVSKIMEKLGFATDIEFSEFLLQKAEVAVVPGSAFFAPGCMRISYATSEEILTEAIERMKKAIDQN